MTSVVTVSASTAAYAVEPVKPANRVTGSSFMEASLEAITQKAAQTDDPRQKVILNVVRPPALALFFLTSEDVNRGPVSSREHVESEYRATMAMGSEQSAPAEETSQTAEADKPNQAQPVIRASETAVASQTDQANLVANTAAAASAAPDFAPQSAA